MERESAWYSGNVCLLSGKQGFKYCHGSEPESGAPSPSVHWGRWERTRGLPGQEQAWRVRLSRVHAHPPQHWDRAALPWESGSVTRLTDSETHTVASLTSGRVPPPSV